MPSSLEEESAVATDENKEQPTTTTTTNTRGSPLEICSFVVHFLLLFPIGFFFILWVLVLPPEEDDTTSSSEYYYYYFVPPKSWLIHIPTSLLCLFFASPLLYAACNSTILAPRIDSLDTLYDDYTRQIPSPAGKETAANDDESSLLLSVPDIYDLDPSTLRWYSHVDGKPICQ